MPAFTQFMGFLHLFYLPTSRLMLLPGQNIPSPFTCFSYVSISLCLSLGADCSSIPVPDTPDTHGDILLCLPIPRGHNCERTSCTQHTEVGTTYKMATSTIRIYKNFHTEILILKQWSKVLVHLCLLPSPTSTSEFFHYSRSSNIPLLNSGHASL